MGIIVFKFFIKTVLTTFRHTSRSQQISNKGMKGTQK